MSTLPADSEQQAALAAITELLTAHYSEAVDSAVEDGKFGIGFKIARARSRSPAIKIDNYCQLPHLDSHANPKRQPPATLQKIC